MHLWSLHLLWSVVFALCISYYIHVYLGCGSEPWLGLCSELPSLCPLLSSVISSFFVLLILLLSQHSWWIVNREMSLSSTVAASDCQSLSNLPPTPMESHVEILNFPAALDSTSTTSSCTISVSIPTTYYTGSTKEKGNKKDERLTIWRYFEVDKDPNIKHFTFCLMCNQEMSTTLHQRLFEMQCLKKKRSGSSVQVAPMKR